jgi:selenide,water dikinase
MKDLNRAGGELAARFRVNAMTDITGFGLAGHALKMAEASKVSLRIHSGYLPTLKGAWEVFEKGSIPGAAFRNQEFCGKQVHFTRSVPYSLKMLTFDAQTSGGLLMSVPRDLSEDFCNELKTRDPRTSPLVIGEVLEESPRRIYIE